MSRNIGLTKTAAYNMSQRGYPISYIAAINRARPTLPAGVQYVATPVQEEMLMLYSFKDPEAAKAFAEGFPDAQALD